MPQESSLSEEDRDKLGKEVGHADILIGIPGYNNESTIGEIVKSVGTGLSEFFPKKSALLVISDGGSHDDTRRVVEQSAGALPTIVLSHYVNPYHKISTPYHGIPGKGNAFRSIFEIANTLNVKACAILDSDLRSCPPEWMRSLLHPILAEGYDYVAPDYQRHRYDGAITNGIVYPLIRSLYGRQIRQPIGGQFSFTGGLAGTFLVKNVWETEVGQYSIETWMTASAITGGKKICQAHLGTKTRDARGSSVDLSTMLVQVLGSVFGLMDEDVDHWKNIKGSETVPTFGSPRFVALDPVKVNADRMVKAFVLGLNEFQPIWEKVLSREVREALGALKSASGKSFHLPDQLWVRIIYDFALATHRKTMNRGHLLKSFTPLYIGRVASFILETEKIADGAVEDKVERLCRVFESEKPYLVEQWSAADQKTD